MAVSSGLIEIPILSSLDGMPAAFSVLRIDVRAMHEIRIMALGLEQVGVVVVMEKTVVSGLAKLADRHGWSLIHLPTAAQVVKKIGRQKLDIAVVHIAVELQQTVEFIRWLRLTRQEILLIAAASTHREEAERTV